VGAINKSAQRVTFGTGYWYANNRNNNNQQRSSATIAPTCFLPINGRGTKSRLGQGTRLLQKAVVTSTTASSITTTNVQHRIGSNRGNALGQAVPGQVGVAPFNQRQRR